MSPTKRPSTVAGLRRGVGRVPAAAPVTTPAAPVTRVKPARVTLNMPPELYRRLSRWTDSAAETLDVPRVGVQEALRAMVHVLTSGQARNVEQQVLVAIREELGG